MEYQRHYQPTYTHLNNVRSNNQIMHQYQPTYSLPTSSRSTSQTSYQQNTMLNPSSQDITMATLQNFNTQSDRGDQPPKCDLRCKCCAVQMAFGLVCACNLTKESVGTQTDILVLNMTTEDYFKPKTTAFKLLQNQITSVLHTTKLSSTSDKTFEDSVSEVINFINDLPDTPRTREKVRTRFRKRMYNQKGYEKTKELAIATGGSVRKLQWKKAREVVIPPKQARASFKQRNISIVSSATTSPISSPAVSPVSTPSNSPQTSPTQPPMISPALSVSSHTPEQLPQTNSLGVHFKVGDNVCIASGGKTYDFATVEKIWTSRVDITYLKKAGPKLSTWKLGSGKLYKDSIHKNSVFHCLGKVDLVEVGWRSPLKIQRETWKKFLPQQKFRSAPAPGQDSNVENTEPPAKKKKQENEEISIQITNANGPRVLFTGFMKGLAKKLQANVIQLGGMVTENPKQCTHVVAPAISRTMKFFIAVNVCKYVVTKEWLEDSMAKNRFADPNMYALRDIKAETEMQCNLQDSISRAQAKPLFQDVTIYATPSIVPPISDLTKIVGTAGGTVVKRLPSIPLLQEKDDQGNPTHIVVTCEDDVPMLRNIIAKKITIHNAEFVLTGVMRQTLDFKAFVIDVH